MYVNMKEGKSSLHEIDDEFSKVESKLTKGAWILYLVSQIPIMDIIDNICNRYLKIRTYVISAVSARKFFM